MLKNNTLIIPLFISLSIHFLLTWGIHIEHPETKLEPRKLIVTLINESSGHPKKKVIQDQKKTNSIPVQDVSISKLKITEKTKKILPLNPSKHIPDEPKIRQHININNKIMQPKKTPKNWYGIAKSLIHSEQEHISKQRTYTQNQLIVPSIMFENAPNFLTKKTIEKEKFLFKRQLGKRSFTGFGIKIFKDCYLGFKAIDPKRLEVDARNNNSLPSIQGPFTCDF